MTPLLAESDRRLLLRAARQAIADSLAGRTVATPAAEGPFALRAGVFVSLHRHGDLRGCIGHPDGDQPLAAVLGRCAVAAAQEDPRFPRVTPPEMEHIDIEISVLGRIEPVQSLEDVDVGRHGLIADQDGHRGLLLPQVATEHGWSREAFASQTCRKAGLRPDAWKRGARLFRFEAEVFGEDT